MSILVFIIFILLGIAFFTLFERKILSYSQNRLGPNKVGGLGLLQPAFDGVKLLLKECLFPFQVFSLGFLIFPSLVFPIMLCTWLIPSEVLGFNISIFLSLFLLSLVGFGVFGVMISGITSNSKFSYLGGLRASAQSVSYEIIFSLILFCTILGMGSLFWENSSLIMMFLLPFWVLSIISEVNRAPFDFAEGESELISGFNTEFSSSIFVLIFLSEYGMVLIFALMTSSLFFSSSVFMGGIMSLFFLFLRSCFPRFRFDMLMGFCWLFLLPISIFFLFLFFLVLKE